MSQAGGHGRQEGISILVRSRGAAPGGVIFAGGLDSLGSQNSADEGAGTRGDNGRVIENVPERTGRISAASNGRHGTGKGLEAALKPVIASARGAVADGLAVLAKVARLEVQVRVAWGKVIQEDVFVGAGVD